ncbi:MAG: encapsulin, partial [Planctomycetaceae bacterium]|nr:encapsulin [Planctomycetaceae bacterium]
MNDLKRELAPIAEQAWAEIEEEVTRTLKRFLAGRRLVDFDGPKGWQHSSVNLGRAKELDSSPFPQTTTRLREIQPLVELRTVFELSRTELDNISRGASDADLDPAVEAAKQLALAE